MSALRVSDGHPRSEARSEGWIEILGLSKLSALSRHARNITQSSAAAVASADRLVKSAAALRFFARSEPGRTASLRPLNWMPLSFFRTRSTRGSAISTRVLVACRWTAPSNDGRDPAQKSSIVTSPAREIFAMNGGCLRAMTRRMRGNALMKISASVSARRSPCATKTNARTRARRRACFSAAR